MPEPVDRSPQQEEQRAQPQHREDIRSENNDHLLCDPKYRRDRVHRENDIGRRQQHNHYEKTGIAFPAIADHRESPAAILLHQRQKAAKQPIDRIPLDIRLFSMPGDKKPPSADDEHQPADIKDPVRLIDKDDPRGNKNDPQEDRDEDTDQQNPGIMRGLYAKKGKDENKDEDIVHAQTPLHHIGTQILERGLVAFLQPKKDKEEHPQQHPEQGQQQRLFNGNCRSLPTQQPEVKNNSQDQNNAKSKIRNSRSVHAGNYRAKDTAYFLLRRSWYK